MDDQKRILGVSRTVFALGIVSLLTDISSEMLVPVIPQFLAFVLGASGVALGTIEGIAECTASVLRVYAGYIADRTGHPKLLTVIGYGLSAVAKPFFALAGSWHQVLALRFADRLGKGIRSAPRDVLIADATDEASRGRAFGLHRSMDTVGALLGPLIVIAVIALVGGWPLREDLGLRDRGVYTLIFLAATIPAVLGWIVLVVCVRERRKEDHNAHRPEIKLSHLDRRFRLFLLAVTVFSIGNSSDAFLVLRARSAPINLGFLEVLIVYAAFNGVAAAVSLASGIFSDRIGRKPVVIAGWLVFTAAYFAFGRVNDSGWMVFWFIVYGVYYGMTSGVLRAYAVDLAPAHLRGTAVGAFFTFTGVALLPASLIAGFLWDSFGPSGPFYYGAATSLIAVVLLAGSKDKVSPTEPAHRQ